MLVQPDLFQSNWSWEASVKLAPTQNCFLNNFFTRSVQTKIRNVQTRSYRNNQMSYRKLILSNGTNFRRVNYSYIAKYVGSRKKGFYLTYVYLHYYTYILYIYISIVIKRVNGTRSACFLKYETIRKCDTNKIDL